MNYGKILYMSEFSNTIRAALLALLLMIAAIPAWSQDTLHLSLQDAIQRGVDSSKELRLSQAKVQEAMARLSQAKDQKLPSIKASLMASEAYIPTRTLQIKGLMDKAMKLPSTSMIYLGTFGVNQAIFAGNKLKYAEESAQLLQQIAGLEAQGDQESVVLSIIQSYINLFKIDENLKILHQNLQDVEGRLEETIKFKDQGLATENDVLRFELQKANVQLSLIDLQNNRRVANYAMDILLGFPEQTILQVDSVGHPGGEVIPLQTLIDSAMVNRQELAAYRYRHQISDLDIRNIKADKLPTLGAGLTTYYLNPTKRLIPPAHSFLVPVTLGLNFSWNISSLYTTKHRLSEAEIKRQEVQVSEQATVDKIKVEVNKDYRAYLQSLERIDVLKTAVAQARENDRIMELKYRNQLATTTDRIDAQTLLYQSLVNLGLAQADASAAYFQLLRSTGTLNDKP